MNLTLDDAVLGTIPAGRYQVVIAFVVGKDGGIQDVLVAADPGYGLGKRASNVVSNYKGCWEPAQRNGRPVRWWQKLPITFVIDDDDVTEMCKGPVPTEIIP